MIRAMKGDLAEATEAALAVLGGNRDSIAAIYVRGNILMRPIRLDNRLEAGASNGRWVCSTSMSSKSIGFACDWRSLRSSALDGRWHTTDRPSRRCLPLRVCRDTLGRSMISGSPMARGVPPLLGIIETPIVTLDGRVVQDPGCDATTGLLFDPGAARFPRISERSTRV